MTSFFYKIPLLFALFFCRSFNVSAQDHHLSVLFDFDSASLTTSSLYKLDSAFSNTRNVDSFIVKGHCDAIGNDAFNDLLSERRTVSVINYLHKKGVDDRVIGFHKGYGKRQPLNNNTTVEERSLNRRVELTWKIKPESIVLKDTVSFPAIVSGSGANEGKTVNTSITQAINDSNLHQGEHLVLKNMNFQGGRHILLPQSMPVLVELFQVMVDHPTLEIEIQGHVCCTPPGRDGLDLDTQTFELSVNRAKAIYEYLVKKGIDPKRLSYQGFGIKHPIYYPEINGMQQTANRRVEIKIVKK